MKQAIAIQQHSGSTRLKDKYKAEFGGVTMTEFLYYRLKKVHEHVFVLGHLQDNDLKDYCEEKGIEYFLAPTDPADLTSRYLYFARTKNIESFVRITGDCPLINLEYVKWGLNSLKNCDYVTNCSPRAVVDGWDVQGISADAFEWYAKRFSREEHLFYNLENDHNVYKAFDKAGFVARSMIPPDEVILNPFKPTNKMSVDTLEDLERARTYWKKISG